MSMQPLRPSNQCITRHDRHAVTFRSSGRARTHGHPRESHLSAPHRGDVHYTVFPHLRPRRMSIRPLYIGREKCTIEVCV